VPSPQAPDWAQPRAERHLFRPRARRPAGAIRGAAACRDGWRPPVLRPEDSVEETWRVVQPLLDHPPDVRPCPGGSWGPEEAETLLRGRPRWQQPWLPEEGW